MFTGLIKDVGKLVRITRHDADCVLAIATKLDVNAMPLGASVACNGVCLTVTGIVNHSFEVMVSTETLSKTTIADWVEGTRINLEPSLKMGDELGGHFVYGHVDAKVVCIGKHQDGQSWRYGFAMPNIQKGLIVPKGSVALNGVSLTVNEVNRDTFGVNIIPHTVEHTNFADCDAGHFVNLEIDMMARYAAAQAENDDMPEKRNN